MENGRSIESEKVSMWRRRFEQFERSGLSQMSFCREHGLALSTFTLWKRRLKLRATERPAFIPVELKKEPARTASSGAWACEIAGPQVKLRLRAVPDAAGLRELIALISGEA